MDLFFSTAGEVNSFHTFDVKNMPKVMSYNSYAIDWRKTTNNLMYRFHSCNCNNCMGDFSECQCIDFVGPWESVDLKIVPRPPPTAMQLHKLNMGRLLQSVLPVLDSPVFCLARQENVQWPVILYVLPGAKCSQTEFTAMSWNIKTQKPMNFTTLTWLFLNSVKFAIH